VVNPSSPTTNRKQETEEQETGVAVVALFQQLESFGIAKRCATKLIANYPVGYIREKVALAKALVAKGSALISQNPAGWLRRAIEEDYQLPSLNSRRTHRFRHKAVRHHGEQPPVAAEEVRLPEDTPEPSVDPSPADMDTKTVWGRTLASLQQYVPAPAFATWVKDTVLLGIGKGVATITVPSSHVASWLERRLYWRIVQALRDILPDGEVREVQFVTA
jgi:hypothetical protein